MTPANPLRLRFFKPILVAWATLFMLSAAPVWADPIPEIHSAAIGGYSPVSYFTRGVAEQGSVDFAVSHAGQVYYLTSSDQVALFEAAPERYRPRHDVCAFSLTEGMQKALDPTNFKIVGGTLLLFHKTEGMDGLAGWESSSLTDAELLDRADSQYVLLRF